MRPRAPSKRSHSVAQKKAAATAPSSSELPEFADSGGGPSSDSEGSPLSVNAYRTLGETTLERGEPLLAYDLVCEALEQYPGDIRLRQLQGLALARSGATERAQGLLEQLAKEGHGNEETLGMLARTYKDLFARVVDARQKRSYLQEAANIYMLAYESGRGYWSGINA